MKSLTKPVKSTHPLDLERRPPFKFRCQDQMFAPSVAFARKLDRAHDHATKMNWHFKGARTRS